MTEPVGRGFPENSGLIASASGTNTDFIVSAIFNKKVKLEVGDICYILHQSQCVRNGADFYINGGILIPFVDRSGLTDGELIIGISGLAIHGAQRINNSFSITKRVTTETAISSISLGSYLTVGTAPISIVSFLEVIVYRP